MELELELEMSWQRNAEELMLASYEVQRPRDNRKHLNIHCFLSACISWLVGRIDPNPNPNPKQRDIRT